MNGYKLFRKKNDLLYPLYVLADEPTPIGVWLPAKMGVMTNEGKVKSKLGALAYRPGWHINDKAPYVEHIYSVHNGCKYLKDNCVWCEVEYHTDINYQPEAREAGWRAGKWSAQRAYLKKIPVNGYYKYKTNPNMFGSWVIAGEMLVVRELTDDDVFDLCFQYGLIPLRRWSA